MVLRNKAVFWQLVLSLAFTAAAVLIARAADPGSKAWLVAGALGLGLTALHATYTAARYRELADLATRIDAALENGREVKLDDMREGEIAILANEVDKTLNRLSVSNAELAHEKTALADALADISHQLRTPLTSLGLELELLRGTAKDAAQREHVMHATALLDRVQWLVNALLKMARIESGSIRLVREPVLVDDLVREAFAPLALAYDLADVSFEAEVTAGARFEGDARWSAEALGNLLKNALEHTPAGGTVRVEATEDTLACRIAVVDSGEGIAEEDLPYVFDRFWRREQLRMASSEVNPAGVGIGLSLAQALVTAQGGTIKASNARDASGEIVGARFEMIFFKQIV